MNQEKILQGSLLFHAVHGLCCVKQLIKNKENGKSVMTYSLEPKNANKTKVRFTISESNFEASGFHPLVSTSQANGILRYLKNGDASKTTPPAEHEASRFAKEILSFSYENKEAKDQRSRQRVERSVSGLVGELSVVFKTDLKAAAAMVRKSLGNASKINPLILTALSNAGDS
jgi:RNA polymerase-interacting CarD/CdnL/TRCF family regulator